MNEEDVRCKYALHLEKYELTHIGGFRRIYPNNNEKDYVKFFDQSTSLCAETAASRARTELSKLQREDLESKQREMENYRKRFTGVKPARNEDVRPESPTNEKKRPKCLPIQRRVPSLRVPLYNSKAGFKNEVSETGNRETERTETVTISMCG